VAVAAPAASISRPAKSAKGKKCHDPIGSRSRAPSVSSSRPPSPAPLSFPSLAPLKLRSSRSRSRPL
jgi:hypothetical protein